MADRHGVPQSTPYHETTRPIRHQILVFFVPWVVGAVIETMLFSKGSRCQTIWYGGSDCYPEII